MSEHIESNSNGESIKQRRGVDLEGRVEELRLDIDALLKRGDGIEILDQFCRHNDIQVNGDVTSAVLDHFRSLDQKPKTLSKFRSKLTRWMHKSL